MRQSCRSYTVEYEIYGGGRWSGSGAYSQWERPGLAAENVAASRATSSSRTLSYISAGVATASGEGQARLATPDDVGDLRLGHDVLVGQPRTSPQPTGRIRSRPPGMRPPQTGAITGTAMKDKLPAVFDVRDIEWRVDLTGLRIGHSDLIVRIDKVDTIAEQWPTRVEGGSNETE